MAETANRADAPVTFETHPSTYVHWKLSIDGPVARLLMDVQEDRPMREGYVLKTNSYDLGVDIELADAVERLRFEHPQVRCLIWRESEVSKEVASRSTHSRHDVAGPLLRRFTTSRSRTACQPLVGI